MNMRIVGYNVHFYAFFASLFVSSILLFLTFCLAEERIVEAAVVGVEVPRVGIVDRGTGVVVVVEVPPGDGGVRGPVHPLEARPSEIAQPKPKVRYLFRLHCREKANGKCRGIFSCNAY